MAKLGKAWAVGLLAAALAGCGSGGGDGMDPPAANLTGDWQVKLIRDAESNDCTGSFNELTVTVPLAVAHPEGSNHFTVTNGSLAVSADGTIDGRALQFQISPDLGSYCDQLDIDVQLMLGPTGSYADGTATWTCTNGDKTCGGIDLVSADRD